MTTHRPLSNRARMLPSRLGILALLAATSLYSIAYACLAPMRLLVTKVFDDAGYYFEIAHNIVSGHGISFDSLHPPNGVQPLWLILILPLEAFSRLSPEIVYRAGLVFQIALLALAFWLLERELGHWFAPRVRLLAIAMMLFTVFLPAVNGMESAILILTLVLLFAYGRRGDVFGRDDPRAAYAFGLIAGLVALARLDMIFLLAAVGLASLLAPARSGSRASARGETRARFERTAAIGAGVSTLVAPYLAFNWITTGHLMPISGALKTSFPAIAHSGSLIARFGARHLLFLAIGAFALAITAARALRVRSAGDRRFDYFDGSVAVASLAMLLHAAYSFAFMNWAVFRWHFIWYGLAAGLALCRPIASWTRTLRADRAPWIHAPVLAAVLLVGGLETYRKDFPKPAYDWHQAAYDAARWARTHTPKNAIFAMNDAGIFGFFSERPVVNLDGVANNLAYQDALRAKRLGAYLRDSGVQYIVDHNAGKHVDVDHYRATQYDVLSHRYHVVSDPITLRRADEVFRGPTYQHEGRYDVACIIWKLPHADLVR